jgi:hypothetical protein
LSSTVDIGERLPCAVPEELASLLADYESPLNKRIVEIQELSFEERLEESGAHGLVRPWLVFWFGYSWACGLRACGPRKGGARGVGWPFGLVLGIFGVLAAAVFTPSDPAVPAVRFAH